MAELPFTTDATVARRTAKPKAASNNRHRLAAQIEAAVLILESIMEKMPVRDAETLLEISDELEAMADRLVRKAVRNGAKGV